MKSTENKDNQNFALIIGGSVGIGFELAKCFAKDGYNLILASRTEDDLEKAANCIKQLI